MTNGSDPGAECAALQQGAETGPPTEAIAAAGFALRIRRVLFAAAALSAIVGNAWLAAVVLFGRGDHFTFIRLNYDWNTLYLPPVLMATAILGTWMTRREGGRGIRRNRGAALLMGAGVLLLLTRVWATHIEPRLLQVRMAGFETPKLARPLRVLHISDIQSDRVGGYERRAFEAMRALKPDLVVFTGDLLQPLPPVTYATEIPKIAVLLDGLSAPLGKFAVIGDVDAGVAGPLRKGMGGLRLLDEGEEATVALGEGRRLQLKGLSIHQSHWGAEFVRRPIEAWLERVAPGDLTLLLGHAPDFVLVARDYPIDLCLAGHTHGGQIRIPWFGPIMTLSQVPRAWARGWRTVGQTRLNVSAGIGTEHIVGMPAIRINCPPEMTLIEIRPAGD